MINNFLLAAEIRGWIVARSWDPEFSSQEKENLIYPLLYWLLTPGFLLIILPDPATLHPGYDTILMQDINKLSNGNL